MELKILYVQKYLQFYCLYLSDMTNDILQTQTEQKEKKHLFLFPLWIQHLCFHLLFPKNQ